MSFTERNKFWLLPLLGLVLAWVAWLNLPGAEPAKSGPRHGGAPGGPAGPAGREEPSFAGLDAEDEVRSPDPGGESEAPGEGGPKALEPPPPEANETASLLLEGRRALGSGLREPAPAALHPDQWRGLYRPGALQAAVPGPAPRTPFQAPVLDFLIETPTRREAWINGTGYRTGEVLGDGHTLKRIKAASVVLAAPGGEVEVALGSGAPVSPGSASPRPQGGER